MSFWNSKTPQYISDSGDAAASKIANEYFSNYAVVSGHRTYRLTELEVRFQTSNRFDIFDHKLKRNTQSWTYYTNPENEHHRYLEANLKWDASHKVAIRINGICAEDGKPYPGTKKASDELVKNIGSAIDGLSLENNNRLELIKSASGVRPTSILSVPRNTGPSFDPSYNRACWRNYRFYNLEHNDALSTLQDQKYQQIVALSLYARNELYTDVNKVMELVGLSSQKVLNKWVQSFNEGLQHGSISSRLAQGLIRQKWASQNVANKCFLYGAWCSEFGSVKNR